jgi:uncharacterized OB-fold protein
MQSQTILPEPTELTTPWWSACDEKKLLVQECDSCRRRWFTPEAVCIHCTSQQWSWVESTGIGHVYSLTIVHRAPRPEFDAPYVIAVVELDDGWSMLTNLIGRDPEAWRNGDRVKVTFRPAGSRMSPAFEWEETS